ncbi:MAG: FtsX-like permease family protein [Dehalococcoidia bacterium]|nr:FtsX-like permease family protein [Dehalococcoidia bacterium]
MARRNLFAEKARFAISVAGVAFAILLVLIVLGLYRGWSRTGETIARLPGDVWVVQAGTIDPFHSASLVQAEQLSALRALAGVEAVTPVLARRMTVAVNGDDASIYLFALQPPDAVSLSENVRRDYLPPPGEIYVDAILSAKTGLDVGDTVSVGGRELRVGRVAGRSGEAFIQFVFANFDDTQAIFGVGGAVNYAVLSLAPGVRAEETMATVAAADPRLGAFTREAFARSIRKEIDESFLPIIGILLAIGFVVGAAVVGLTIYTATIERSREFGVLKAVGASGTYLYRIVFSQSLILTLSGFAVGAMATFVVARLATATAPEFATDFRPLDVTGVALGTGLMALAASFVPVRRVVHIDPASVFRA